MEGAAPQLPAVQGVGPDVAAQLLFTVGGSPLAYDPKLIPRT